MHGDAPSGSSARRIRHRRRCCDPKATCLDIRGVGRTGRRDRGAPRTGSVRRPVPNVCGSCRPGIGACGGASKTRVTRTQRRQLWRQKRALGRQAGAGAPPGVPSGDHRLNRALAAKAHSRRCRREHGPRKLVQPAVRRGNSGEQHSTECLSLPIVVVEDRILRHRSYGACVRRRGSSDQHRRGQRLDRGLSVRTPDRAHWVARSLVGRGGPHQVLCSSAYSSARGRFGSRGNSAACGWALATSEASRRRESNASWPRRAHSTPRLPCRLASERFPDTQCPASPITPPSASDRSSFEAPTSTISSA